MASARTNQAGRCLALTLGLIVAVALETPAGARAAEASAAIPSFWNPDAPPEKPDLAGLSTIRFVTSSDFPPFDFTLPDGTPTGFDADLARALCTELGVTCTIQALAWDAIVPAIERGQGDAAIASLGITGAARRKVDFTAPYLKTPARFVVRGSALETAGSARWIEGRSVAVQAGTAHAAYLAAIFPGARAVPFPSVATARAALQAGTVDAMFGDAIASASWLDGTEAAGCCAFAGGAFTESRFFGQGAGIAVRKGDVTLRQALDYGLARVANKGVFADLYLKYFPVGFY